MPSTSNVHPGTLRRMRRVVTTSALALALLVGTGHPAAAAPTVDYRQIRSTVAAVLGTQAFRCSHRVVSTSDTQVDGQSWCGESAGKLEAVRCGWHATADGTVVGCEKVRGGRSVPTPSTR